MARKTSCSVSYFEPTLSTHQPSCGEEMSRSVLCWSFFTLLIAGISGCDDSISSPSGGASGTPTQDDLTQGQQIGNAVSGNQAFGNANGCSGFGSPQDTSQFGTASFTSDSLAKIDTDGDPSEQGYDQTWNAQTSGQIDGQPVNTADYAYVVM